MTRPLVLLLPAAAAAIGMGPSDASDGRAWGKTSVAFAVPVAESNYVQRPAIDVGDVPGHQFRIYERHQALPAAGPRIEGLRVVDIFTRIATCYTETHTPSAVSFVYTLENGDKIFSRAALEPHSVTNTRESRKLPSTLVAGITGGTGRYSNIQGWLKAVTTAGAVTGLARTQTEMWYWTGPWARVP